MQKWKAFKDLPARFWMGVCSSCFFSHMITGNCTRIEKFLKCYRDVSKFLIAGFSRPENKKWFGSKSEHGYWKIILPWDVKFQFRQISTDTKNVEGR